MSLFTKDDLDQVLNDRVDCNYMNKTITFIYSGAKKDNLNLNPQYQRGDVWSLERKRFLINSLLNGISIPPIILNRRGNKYDVIDGKQRITAINGFINNEYFIEFDNKKVYFNADNLSEEIIETCFVMDDDCRSQLKETEVQFVCYDNLDDYKQREIFERINYGSPLNYGEKLRGCNSKALVYIENLINDFSCKLEEMGVKNERQNHYLKFATIMALTENNFKCASSGNPVLKYISDWKHNDEYTLELFNKTKQNLTKIYDLFKIIITYHKERTNTKYSKERWNWGEILFNIYCVNINFEFKDLIKFNKYLYHVKSKNRYVYDILDDFKDKWERWGRKNTNNQDVYDSRLLIMKDRISIINKNIPKSIKDKLMYDYFEIRKINQINCPVCEVLEDNNVISKNNFHCGHIISRNNGGIVDIINLRPICGNCNSKMGSKDLDVYCKEIGNTMIKL